MVRPWRVGSAGCRSCQPGRDLRNATPSLVEQAIHDGLNLDDLTRPDTDIL